ncbi:MAG: DinB family protein, partial [Dinghuibacter sp.]|nr:DinB family protein [Dinghuibacter sp.]
GKWSTAQVLEHLNIYARYYITAIEQQLHGHNTTPQKTFTPGWLGNYFTRIMQPPTNNSGFKKMRSPKNAVPSIQPDGKQMLSEFLQHQHHLLNILNIAAQANLGRLRIPTSLSKFVTLKLGDTFRFFIAHEQRHWVQIENNLAVWKQQQPAVALPA